MAKESEGGLKGKDTMVRMYKQAVEKCITYYTYIKINYKQIMPAMDGRELNMGCAQKKKK